MLDTIFAIHSTSRNLQHLPLRQGFVSRSRLKGLRELALLLLETAAHSTLNRTPEKSAVTRHERSSWHQRERERARSAPNVRSAARYDPGDPADPRKDAATCCSSLRSIEPLGSSSHRAKAPAEEGNQLEA